MQRGDIVRICMDWSPYHGTIGIVTGLHSYETASVFIPSWGTKHLDCEVLEVVSDTLR